MSSISKGLRRWSRAHEKLPWLNVSDELRDPETETAGGETRMTIEETEDEAAAGPGIAIDHQELTMNVAPKLSLRSKRSDESARRKQRPI
jgi:hypothetical protein